jgi:antitoxin (DNA-binding transcriptional repressor) of toxin-antitoxin stability system
MVQWESPSTVGVRELRQNLSVYLERVKKGEALTVTEHGSAVALLRPLPAGGSALDRLVAGGHARPPARGLAARPTPLAVKLQQPLSELLEDERSERL